MSSQLPASPDCLAGLPARYRDLVSFEVPAEVYGQMMERYSSPLAAQLADLGGVRAGQRALDVGCGPGALTSELVRRLGPESVCAVDPSESFAAAARTRLPGVGIRVSAAEQLPFADNSFDVTLAQLVVQFMADPEAGVREMARVTRPDGLVAACVWDNGGGRGPLSLFWQAARDLDPSAVNESRGTGSNEGELAALLVKAGLDPARVESTALTVRAPKISFDDWWAPLELGVGPAGDHVTSLSVTARGRLREHCQRLLSAQPAEISATAWAVSCRV